MDPDEQDAFVTNGDESMRKKLENDLGITIYCKREDGSIKIRGTKSSVLECEAQVRKIIEGPNDGSCISIPILPEVLGTLIGKKANNLKKFKETYGCDFIPMKRSNTLRIRGEPEKVAEAQKEVVEYLKDMKIFTAFKVQFPSSVPRPTGGKNTSMKIFKSLGIDDILATHDANIEIEDTAEGDANVKVKGAPLEVTSLKNMILDLAKGETTNTVILSPIQREKLKQDEDIDGIRWERIRNKNNVSLNIDLE